MSVERAALARAALVGAIVGAAIVGATASSRGGLDRATYGDGLIVQYVASHLSTAPDDIDPVVRDRGSSLRYGRIGLSALVWVAALGRVSAMPFVQPLLMVVIAAAAAAAAAALLPRAGALAGLVPFLAPGFTLSLSGGFAEALGVPLVLWAIVAARDERWAWLATLAAASVLTRENAIPILAAPALWCLIRRRTGVVPALAAATVPVLAWYAFVAARFGHLPPLDPYLRETTDTIGTPVVALVHALTDPASGASLALVLVHVALAIAAVGFGRRTLIGWCAVAAGVQVLVAGRFAWRFIGDGVRTASFLQLFVILLVVELVSSRRAPRVSAEPAPAT